MRIIAHPACVLTKVVFLRLTLHYITPLYCYYRMVRIPRTRFDAEHPKAYQTSSSFSIMIASVSVMNKSFRSPEGMQTVIIQRMYTDEHTARHISSLSLGAPRMPPQYGDDTTA